MRIIAVGVSFPVPGQENFGVARIRGGDVGNEQVIFALNAHVVNQVVIDGVNLNVEAEFLEVGLNGLCIKRKFGAGIVNDKIKLKFPAVLIANAVAVGVFPARLVEELRGAFGIVSVGVF